MMRANAKNAEAVTAPKPNAEAATATLGGSEIGEVKIHENVISALARRATLEVEGVSRLAGSLLVDNIAEIVGSRRMQDRAITVQMGDDNRVSLEIKLNIKIGFRLPKVAAAVQKAVISAIETTTGMTVAKVDVLVQEVEPEVEADDDDNDVPPAANPTVDMPLP